MKYWFIITMRYSHTGGDDMLRLLLSPSENYGHMHIFHTIAHFCDCVCNLILDRGVMHMVLKDAVDKLSLLVEKHSCMYKIVWLNDAMTHVAERCLITFQVNFFEDSVWCDVSHILLRRPCHVNAGSNMTVSLCVNVYKRQTIHLVL